MKIKIGNLEISLSRHLTMVIDNSGGYSPPLWKSVWFDFLWQWESKMIYLTLFSISLEFDWLDLNG